MNKSTKNKSHHHRRRIAASNVKKSPNIDKDKLTPSSTASTLKVTTITLHIKMGDNIISSEDKTQLYDLLLKCHLSDDVIIDLQDASKKSRYKQRYMSAASSSSSS